MALSCLAWASFLVLFFGSHSPPCLQWKSHLWGCLVSSSVSSTDRQPHSPYVGSWEQGKPLQTIQEFQEAIVSSSVLWLARGEKERDWWGQCLGTNEASPASLRRAGKGNGNRNIWALCITLSFTPRNEIASCFLTLCVCVCVLFKKVTDLTPLEK